MAVLLGVTAEQARDTFLLALLGASAAAVVAAAVQGVKWLVHMADKMDEHNRLLLELSLRVGNLENDTVAEQPHVDGTTSKDYLVRIAHRLGLE